MMEEENKRHGRPQVYDGQMSELAKKMQDRRRADREMAETEVRQSAETDTRQTAEEDRRTGEGTVRRGVRGNTPPKSRRLTELLEGKRKREQENILKMRTLGIVLLVLILLLIAALIYEVALGYGTKKTRNERVVEQQRIERRAAPESEETEKEQETDAADEEET